MSDMGNKNIAEETLQSLTQTGGQVAKTAAEEVVNIGTSMVTQVRGRKKKEETDEDLNRLETQKRKAEEEKIRQIKRKLLAFQKPKPQLPKPEDQLEAPKPTPQLQRIEPHLLAKPKRPRGLPQVGKDWAEKRGGWGTSGG